MIESSRGAVCTRRSPRPARIHRATGEDAPAVAALWREAPGAWSFAAVETLLADPDAAAWLAADDAGGAVGVLVARWLDERFDVLGVAVARRARRRSIGSALVERACDEARARGCRVVELEVAAGNEPALSLYRRHRFVAVGRRPRYYGSGEDALLMTRELTDG